MDDPNKKIEHLETEIVSLKMRLLRVEDFILSMPSPDGIPINISQDDDLVKEAITAVLEFGRASTSLLQRDLDISYARAVILINLLEALGLITKSDGTSKPREVIEDKAKAFLEENNVKD